MTNIKLFRDTLGYDEDLANAAHIAARDVLAVKEGERALIITNPDPEVFLISQSIFDAIYKLGGMPTLTVQPIKTQVDVAHPEVLSAFGSSPEIGISISAEKLGKDPSSMGTPLKAGDKEFTHIFDYQLHGVKTMKSFWSPSITVDMFKRTVPIDYPLLRKRCTHLKKIMDAGEKVHVTSPGGTDVEIIIKGRVTDMDDGDFTKGGLGGNLPAGEVYISPTLDASNGLIAFDGSISSHDGEIIIEKTIDCKIENGFVTDVSGGKDAEKLLESINVGEQMARDYAAKGAIPADMLDHYIMNARHIGELGIGLNPEARIVGNMLEDEKVLSTCHFAVGANYDDDAKAMIHLDGLVKNPTIVVYDKDGKSTMIMEAGKLIE